MTFLEKIKPHLISDDFLIQETVLHAIHDFPFLPEEWTVNLLKEAFVNNEKQSSILIYIDNQTINEETVNVLIENIPRMDKSRVHLALNLFNHIDPELALKYREPLAGYIREDIWRLYELIVNGTEEEIFEEYAKMLNSLNGADSYNHDLYIKAKTLASCIAQNNWITEDEIDFLIQEELNQEEFSFLGILTIYIIGLLKLDKYIPTLASLLISDDDILLEEVSAALIQFQSDQVVKAVDTFLKNDDSIIFAASIVENIKSDLAVQVLREAYYAAEEIDHQDILFEALCHQFSKEALPEINEHMNNEFFSSLIDIEQTAYGYYSVIGELHPDLELWRKEAMDREKDYRNVSNQRSLFQNVPVRNENKVGRNDPCPCGSGKKYKKCCGK
jgi:hypothetical protein